MPIPVKCGCGKSLSAPDSLAGKRAKCPACGAPVAIPAAGAPAPAMAPSSGKAPAAGIQGPLAKTAAAFPYACPTCEKEVPVTPAIAGTRIVCPGCGGDLFLPKTPPKTFESAVAPKAASEPAEPSIPSARSGAKATAKPAPTARAGAKPLPPKTEPPTPEESKPLHTHTTCPTCNAFVSNKDAICIHCGLNLVTGKQLTTTHSTEPTGPPKPIAIAALVANLLLPGAGTLFAGRRSERVLAMAQLGVALIGITLWVLIAMDIPSAETWGALSIVPGGSILLPLLPILGAIGWAIPASLAMLKNARPAEAAPAKDG